MKITIPADTDDETAKLILTDEDLDNSNYVELEVENNFNNVVSKVMISVEDLFRAVEVFNKIRLEDKKFNKE